MLSKESLEFLGRLKQAAQRKKKKVAGDQDAVTSDTSMSSMQSAASTAPTDRGALLALAMSSQSSVAPAEGRQAHLERFRIKKEDPKKEVCSDAAVRKNEEVECLNVIISKPVLKSTRPLPKMKR